ncbi:hypothetical protein HG530_008050 [Fusarium avenaceum]|nr:hypothetical protein HG530_008050 [Fusarium avenaceum]
MASPQLPTKKELPENTYENVLADALEGLEDVFDRPGSCAPLSIGPLLVLPELEGLVRTAMAVVGKERRAVVSVTTREIKIGLVLGVTESEYHVRTNDILCPMMEFLPDLSVVGDVVDCRALEIPLSREVRGVVVSLASNILSMSYGHDKQLALYSG